MVKREREINLDTLANDARTLGDNLRYNTSLQILYTGLLMDRYFNMRANVYDQSRSRIQVLNTLITHGGVLGPTELAKMTFVSKQTISRVVDGLERDGLVRRELRGKDHRTKRVRITREGLDSMAKVLPHSLAVADTALPPLIHEQTDMLNSMLRNIRRHLVKLIEEGAGERE